MWHVVGVSVVVVVVVTDLVVMSLATLGG